MVSARKLSTDSEGWESGLDCQQAVGLLDRFDDCFNIEGFDGAEVDDFDFNAIFLLQSFSSDQ